MKVKRRRIIEAEIMSGDEAAAAAATKAEDIIMEMEVPNNTFKVHACVVCDGCQASPIIGRRFKCSDTANYDLCSKCFAAYDGDDLFEETFLGK